MNHDLTQSLVGGLRFWRLRYFQQCGFGLSLPLSRSSVPFGTKKGQVLPIHSMFGSAYNGADLGPSSSLMMDDQTTCSWGAGLPSLGSALLLPPWSLWSFLLSPTHGKFSTQACAPAESPPRWPLPLTSLSGSI